MNKEFFAARFTYVLIILVFFAGLVPAQELVEDNRDYDFTNWRVLFQMNGPNNWNAAVNFVKPIKPKWALRFGISPVVSFNRTLGDEPNGNMFLSFEAKSKVRRLGANVSLGAEFHFTQKGKVDPYILFGSGIGGFSETVKRSDAYTLVEASNSGQLSYESEEYSKSAPQLTINPFAGFGVNYFFHERLAFGIEYSISPRMDLIKGTTMTSRSSKETFEDGTIEDFSLEIDINTFFVNFNQQIGFHLIYTLRNEKK
jgi:hypothetical protein